jgi:hypothetical protein
LTAHVVAELQYPPGQSLSVVHFVAQPVVAEHMEVPQFITAPCSHAPFVQVPAVVKLPALHAAGVQTTALPGSSHAPLPSQFPVLPQVVLPALGHRL